MISSKMASITLKRSGQVIAPKTQIASSFFSRLVGLLDRSSLAPDEALWIQSCNQVHTFFMRFPIDVVFLSKDNSVVYLGTLKPWRISKLVWSARSVLELAQGTCAKTNIQLGDEIEVSS